MDGHVAPCCRPPHRWQGSRVRPGSHSLELDGVRGLAITGVMLMHFVGTLHGESMLERALIKTSMYGGWGVDLFFVLSGFLITGILYDAKTSTKYFRNFYARRTLRIFPLYYAVLLVLFVLVPTSLLTRFDPQLLEARKLQGWIWPYLTNVYLAREGSFAIPYVSHFWSLAVEEHFYLFWPLVVRFLSRVAIMRVSLILALAALALRISLTAAGFNELTTFALTPCRLDALSVGAWFALAMRGPDAPTLLARTPRFTLGVSVAILACSLWHAVFAVGDALTLQLRGSLLALWFGLAIFAVTAEAGPPRWKAILRTPKLRTVGKYAYGLYVFHGIIAYAMHRHDSENVLTRTLGSHVMAEIAEVTLGFGASLLIAVLSYEFFENPLLKLKKRFE
jgi:peptidoglycan/LPS O-acetylase OafA/YrhL